MSDMQLPDEALALVLRRLATKVDENLKTTKAVISGDYEPGDKRSFRSPVDGRKLGSVYRTDPDGDWQIVDRDKLLDHLRGFPGNIETWLEIVGDEAEVLAVLQEHAPHLLEEFTGVSTEAIKAALDQSRATGEAAAPGIEFRKPGGALTVKPDPQADAAIEGLVRAGLVTWDGRRAIASAEQREAS